MSRPLLVIWLTAALAITHGSVWPMRSEAAQDTIVNCNQLDQPDRCDCNRRVLRALADTKIHVSDPTQTPNSTPRDVQDAVQQERRARLRSFYAEGCAVASTPQNLPRFNERAATSATGRAIEPRFQPFFTREICVEGMDCEEPQMLLVGRWDGWQTLSDGRTTPITLHISEVVGTFVTACSSNGMVFGVLRGGFLEVPGPEVSGLAYSLRLWKGGPHFRDLEGVVVLDLRPNEQIAAGLVWLSRAAKFPWSSTPTAYFCEDRELEDGRGGKILH